MAGIEGLTKLADRLDSLANGAGARKVATAAGKAGKEAGLEAASRDLGADRAMSNFRGGKRRLNVGYDAVGSDTMAINFRPAGLWKLASEGRSSTGPIRPRRGRAVMTPAGPRARSTYKPSRGLDTFDDAVRKARIEVPKAAHRAIGQVLAGR